jgi:hypothetical protein
LLSTQFLFFSRVEVSLSRGLCCSGPGLSVGEPQYREAHLVRVFPSLMGAGHSLMDLCCSTICFIKTELLFSLLNYLGTFVKSVLYNVSLLLGWVFCSNKLFNSPYANIILFKILEEIDLAYINKMTGFHCDNSIHVYNVPWQWPPPPLHSSFELCLKTWNTSCRIWLFWLVLHWAVQL